MQGRTAAGYPAGYDGHAPGSRESGGACRQAAQNARDLLAEAEILLDRGRWARAFALAVLASEEFGKGSAAVALAVLPAETAHSCRCTICRQGTGRSCRRLTGSRPCSGRLS